MTRLRFLRVGFAGVVGCGGCDAGAAAVEWAGGCDNVESLSLFSAELTLPSAASLRVDRCVPGCFGGSTKCKRGRGAAVVVLSDTSAASLMTASKLFRRISESAFRRMPRLVVEALREGWAEDATMVVDNSEGLLDSPASIRADLASSTEMHVCGRSNDSVAGSGEVVSWCRMRFGNVSGTGFTS